MFPRFAFFLFHLTSLPYRTRALSPQDLAAD
jgi:hypothetical protein